MSLVGGRRIVLVRQAADGVAKPMEALLGMGGHEALVVLEAGDLGASSALRRLMEKAKTAAAIALLPGGWPPARGAAAAASCRSIA